ncbi:MAG TPA: VIT and VWA domain-containing protein [Anaeromyxobacteraceae bacterium]|nr:VIT and VWA domain-containing protein [Anaeromyxobacteraceae bacterium]
MRTSPIRSLPFLLAGALLLPSPGSASPAGSGGASPVPPPAAGADDRAPADAGPRLHQLLQRARDRAVLAPDPALPEPRRAPPGGASGPPPGFSAREENGERVVEFPLAHTRVYAQVSGNVARVEVTQLYRNPTDRRLEAIYAFPLPPNAAVTDMAFRIGRRVVTSEVKRREEAKRTYQQAKEEGRTAALTEQERPNLFTQSVANVPPGETVAVLLRYVHEVPFDDGRYLFHFPTTIGPRYIPGTAAGRQGPGWAPDTSEVPDASRVTPPTLPPGERPAADVDVMVRLVPGDAFADLGSRSHRVVSGIDGDGARLVALAEGDRRPNKDFVLSWRPAAPEPEAHALLQREKGEDWLMLFVQPPAAVQPAQVRPRELVFLLDKSGSMSGRPIETARAVILRSLRAVGPEDTFQIVAFDGAAVAMSDRPLPATPGNVVAAEAWLSRLEGGGGTEMLQGVLAALGPPADPRRLRMVVFCTDGFIGNEEAIVRAVERTRGEARVFGFGIGTSVNRFLIEGVSRAGRGAAEVVGLREPPDEAVTRLFRRLDRPVLTDLALRFEGGEVRDLEPERLPDLFAGQPLVVVGRSGPRPPRAVLLSGKLGGAPWERRLAVVTRSGASAPEAPVVGTLWARRRIDGLADATPRGVDPRAAVEQVVQLGLRFKLVTAWTSFVAVERELLSDPGLPLSQVVVPNEMPEGVSFEGIFGPATEVKVTPGRVKPGDPEIRVAAPPTVRAVTVALPFEPSPRDAARDPASGDWVLRFLVPSGLPDGSYQARVTLVHLGGRIEERSAPIRVDTTPAAVAVLSVSDLAPGQALRLSMKPALPLSRAAAAARAPAGAADALKGAMEVKEILVRAPWGEVSRARMEGVLGVWRAELSVPRDWRGRAQLEIVASDAAGNVSRRHYQVDGPGGATPLRGVLATLAAVALGGAGLVLRRRGTRQGASGGPRGLRPGGRCCAATWFARPRRAGE